jgi:hypothetical protein
MTILNLEDSKALYDKGIRIETKQCYGEHPFLDEVCKWDTKSCIDPKMNYIPAPDLDELLEYALQKGYEIKFSIVFDKYHVGHTSRELMVFTNANTKVQALANLLLKLKEEGYGV